MRYQICGLEFREWMQVEIHQPLDGTESYESEPENNKEIKAFDLGLSDFQLCLFYCF